MKNIFKIEIDNNRIFGLDLLRAFAIFCVVSSHGNELLPTRINNFLTKFLFFDGVSIFFVLSGFLVGSIFIRDIEQKGFSKTTILNFWSRRWFRTLPAYFFVFALLILIYIMYNPAFSVWTLWMYPFFLQNFASPIPMFFTESWSLSVEEWFYLIIPILITLLLKTGKITLKQSIIVVSLLIILLSTTLRLYRYYWFFPNSELLIYILNIRLQVVTRLDGIMYGVSGAFFNHYYKPEFVKHKKKLVIISFILWIFTGYSRRFYPENTELYVDSIYWWVIDFNVVGIATLLLLPYLSEWKVEKGFFYKQITKISLISYSMYLLNAGVIQGFILNTFIPWNNYTNNIQLIIVAKYLLFWFLVVTLSILLYKYFELPMMKLRDNDKLKTFFRIN